MAEEESLITAVQRLAFSTSTSQQVPPLDSDDLLTEILLRLAPRHYALPRVALVCRRWRRLVAEPAFLRRFRARMPPPPLLGFLTENRGEGELVFTPAHQPPGEERRTVRLSPPPRLAGERWSLLGCRHGLALFANRSRREAVVWDPATGLERAVPYPREFARDRGVYGLVCDGAVACAGAAAGAVLGRDCRFSLVLHHLHGDHQHVSSKKKVTPSTSVMAGNAFYWQLWPTVLEFDMDTQNLAAIQSPEQACATGDDTASFEIARTQDGELGLAVLSELRIRLWARKVDSRGHGAAEWVLKKTFKLEQLLSLMPPEAVKWWEGRPASNEILGSDEDNNTMIFGMPYIGDFMIDLESNQCIRLFEERSLSTCFPYTSRGNGGDDDRAEMLTNTMSCPSC
ncbi:hypothetical protein PVAP13_2KG186400 [Panicum virgatum]|uniref:F-box domain-containing protein n=1 Tax=Panicum virgatum TaxID=38727 RepID=A0A8T0W135_PANVG|nr:hypothetical protein PVAP13_2KG186400 [Panicum virgatum]